MLRVKIEIVPFGEEEKAYTIHTLNIGNMGPSMIEGFHKYHAWLDDDPRGKAMRPEPHAEVHHKREEGALVLAKKVLRKIIFRQTQPATKE